MSESLEVWLDCDLCQMQRLGTLAHDRGQVRFHYDKTWLTQQDIAFAIDPQLTLDAGPFFPKPEAGNFGVFLDSSPDRCLGGRHVVAGKAGRNRYAAGEA